VRDPRAGIIVVEGFPRPGGAAVGNFLNPVPNSMDRPDLQIQTNRPMGNGSLIVCDTGGPPQGGGVRPLPTPSYDEADQNVTLALQDWACRFGALTPSNACTRDACGNPSVVNSSTTLQFCHLVNSSEAFPLGDTLVTVRLRDDPNPPGPFSGPPGNIGPTARIIIRVVTPGP
jgi:hypothetical protein